MKQLLVILSLFLIVFSACQDDQETVFQETGIVVDYTGSGSCAYVIELDNGTSIQALYYPDNFTFTNGQRVLVKYTELTHLINGCDHGIASKIEYAEELAGAQYIDLYTENYDSLARNPIYLHEAFVDEDCLYFKISYSGGCLEQTTDLARMHPGMSSSTDVPIFEICHNANNDLCESYFTKEFRYDLTPLKLEGKKELILKAKLVNGEVYNKTFVFN